MATPKVVVQIDGDNDGALQAIVETDRRIKEAVRTVETMGKNMSASSAMAQRAFRAEADEVRALLGSLKATEAQHKQLDKAIQSTNARIAAARRETALTAERSVAASRQVGGAVRQMAFGLEGLARSGNLAGEGLKSIIAQGSELAFSFGAAGPIVAATAVVGVAIFNVFKRTRDEIAETAKKAREEIANLQNAGNITGIIDRARAIDIGQPSAGISDRVSGAFKGSLRDLRAELAELDAIAKKNPFFGLDEKATERARHLRSEIAKLEKELESLRQAAINIANATPERGLLPIVTTADAPSVGSKREDERRKEILAELTKTMAKATPTPDFLPSVIGGNANLKTGAIADVTAKDPFAQWSISAVDASERLSLVSMALGGINSALGDMGAEAESQFGRLTSLSDVAHATIWNTAQQGLASLIRGHESTGKILKKAAAEPIVAKLKMEAVEHGKKAAGALADLNVPKAAAHGAAAAGYLIGAAKVAQLGGIGGGGGDAGSGGSAPSARGGAAAGLGSSLGASQGEQLVKMEILVVQQAADGRTISRHTQHVQRLKDLDQPLRVTL